MSKTFTNEALNFELLCRHNAAIKSDCVAVEIFRGSDVRRNKHKVAEIKIPLQKAKQAFINDEFFSLVCNEENKLNIPITLGIED